MNKFVMLAIFWSINSIYSMQLERAKSELLGQKEAVTALIVAAYAEVDLVRAQLFNQGDDPKNVRLCALIEGVERERAARVELMCMQFENVRPSDCSSESVALRIAIDELYKWREAIRSQLNVAVASGLVEINALPFCVGTWELLAQYTIQLGPVSDVDVSQSLLSIDYEIAQWRAKELGCVDGQFNWEKASGRIIKWFSY